MITNVDKEAKEMIEQLMTVAMRGLDHTAIVSLAVFKQSIKLIEPENKDEKKK